MTLQIDGRTGEGGGQLVRVAVSLAALTSQPIRITNVRGNRGGDRGGRTGLKSQHVTSIKWLAEATDADVKGLEVGSKTLDFIPRHPPTALTQRHVKISADSSAASTLLVIQAILPFLVFASRKDGSPVTLEVSGGTNVSFSPSFEYLDQILLPTLSERFGIEIERRVSGRGWSFGPQSRGSVWLKIHPLPLGQPLRWNPTAKSHSHGGGNTVESVDVTMIVPATSHQDLQGHLVRNLGVLFPEADVHLRLTEDSHSDSRWSVLLVAHSSNRLRWGHDGLCSMPKKTKSREAFTAQLSRTLCKGLYKEVEVGGHVDVHLQDQLVCFQALCEGTSSFPRQDRPSMNLDASQGSLTDGVDSESLKGNTDGLRRNRTGEPFGHGSLHTQTARWVAAELLPKVRFFDKGNVVEGMGLTFE